MTEKQFTSERTDDYNFSDILDENGKWIGICHIDSADDFVKKFNELLDALNQRTEQCDKYYKENEQLKAQLKKGEDVCSICKYQYLTKRDTDKYYIAKCKKEHIECSKDTVNYCEDFECKEITK